MDTFIPPRLVFDYPNKTREEQVVILESKGLVISDKDQAIKILSQIGYSKFFSHLHPYLWTLWEWKTDFMTVYNSYLFDQKIKTILLEYLLLIEQWFKTQYVYISCKKFNNDTLRWTKESSFQSGQLHNVFLEIKEALDFYKNIRENILNEWSQNDQEKLERKIEQEREHYESKQKQFGKKEFQKVVISTLKEHTKQRIATENWIDEIKKVLDRHNIKLYLERYTDPLYPPIWNVVEDLTFWNMSHLIKDDQTKIIRIFQKVCDLPDTDLRIALKILVDARNICCHNGRLVHFEWGMNNWLKLFLLSKNSYQGKEISNFYYIKVLVQHFLWQIDQKLWEDFNSKIIAALKHFKKEYLLIPYS